MNFKRLVGLLLALFGALSIVGLVFFYGAVLFTTRWPVLDAWHDAFRLLFTTPSGIIVIYAVFLTLFIPLLFCVTLGFWLLSDISYLSKKGVLWLGLLWILALMFASLTFIYETRQMISRLQPFSDNPVLFDVQNEIPVSVQFLFKSTLKNEVNGILGTPIEGYQPHMFLEVFPGLTETDFDGVLASIGEYAVVSGKLEHVLDESKLIHSAAASITDRGFSILLANVSLRLGVDLGGDGTLTEVMDALIRAPQNVATSTPQR